MKTAVNGTEAERWDHYPYGETWVAGAPGDQHRYTGHLHDAESGNDYAGARYYSNIRGRWLSVDPVAGDLANPQRLNRYAYGLNNPANLVDPDGANPFPWWGVLEFMNWWLTNFTVTVVGPMSPMAWASGGVGTPPCLAGGAKAVPDVLEDGHVNPSGLVTEAALLEAQWLQNHSRCAGQLTALASLVAPLLVKGGGGIGLSAALNALSSALIQYGNGGASAADVARAASNVVGSGIVNWLTDTFKDANPSVLAGGATASALIQAFFGTLDARQGIPDPFALSLAEIERQAGNPVQQLAGVFAWVIGQGFPKYGNQFLEDCGFQLNPELP